MCTKNLALHDYITRLNLGVIVNFLDISQHAQNPHIDSEYIVVEAALVIKKLCQTEYIAARVAKSQVVFDNLRKAVELSREPMVMDRHYKWGHNSASCCASPPIS